MRTHIFLILLMFAGSYTLVAQEETLENDEIDVTGGSKYLEDQFYIGLTYNILVDRPSNVSQNNFSNGLQFGFIKDLPLNTRRNVGLGIGLGLAKNSYFSNLQALEVENDIIYEVIGNEPYRRNKVSLYLIEMPFEFRWRTSTIDSYRFWRVYTGVKLGYAISARSKYVSADEKLNFSNPDIDKFQYGVYFSFGYNTWNFYGYYQLNDLFKDTMIESTGEQIKMRALNIGLMFYIL